MLIITLLCYFALSGRSSRFFKSAECSRLPPVLNARSGTKSYVRNNIPTLEFSQNENYSDIPTFNPLYTEKEMRIVVVKYSNAQMYLQGKDMNPLPNFTELAIPLEGNDPTIQVVGSTHKMNLTTYGADLSYYGDVTLGTPAQLLTFDVDTGSADLWVPSGSTYNETGQKFKMSYGTGDVEGIVARESVSIGPFTMREQHFGAVSKESDDFRDVPFDGILGLAFSSISATHEPTFMEHLIREHQLNAPVFGVHLTRHEPRKAEVSIGCYDLSKFVGDIKWNAVTSQSYWNIALGGIRVNGVDTAPRQVTAAIDTGTSLIYLPQDLADAVYRRIPGARRATQYSAGIYTFPCTSRPTVELIFGLHAYEISPQDFNLGKTSSTSRVCVGGILAMGDGFPSNFAIIGDEFLKSWYSIYDYDHGTRVGFAKSINHS